VGLWLSFIPTSRIEAADADRLTRADRLELLRLLRLLLREQVPILDRNEIFGTVCKAGPEWSALDVLPAVRSRIRARLAPAHALDAPATVPAALEALAAQGLSTTDPAIWELPRDRVQALIDGILAWRGRSSAQLVVVRDARLRPFFWRLLVGLVPGPVWVLTEEELQ
jgi:flagellar biosynthesis component FlhA